MPEQTSIVIPPAFAANASRSDEWSVWIRALPGLVRDVVAEWYLVYDGPPTHGYCALVVPVRTTGGRPAMLKLTWPHDEAQHEHLALQAWHGNGTVELLRADPRRFVMLLERLHPEDLTSVRDVEACEIVAGFYRRIHVPALPQMRTLSSYVGSWNASLEALAKDAPIPRRLVEQSVSLARDLLTDERTDDTLIHGDLHYENVLAADREPWLVIDPKPMSGDRHYEVAPLLWNRWDEVVASGNVRDAVRRRFHTVVDTAGLDEDRARDWTVVRETHNALWCIEDAERLGQPLTDEDREWITRAVTIAKAVQD